MASRRTPDWAVPELSKAELEARLVAFDTQRAFGAFPKIEQGQPVFNPKAGKLVDADPNKPGEKQKRTPGGTFAIFLNYLRDGWNVSVLANLDDPGHEVVLWWSKKNVVPL